MSSSLTTTSASGTLQRTAGADAINRGPSSPILLPSSHTSSVRKDSYLLLVDTTRGGASRARLAVWITALHVRALLTDDSVALAGGAVARGRHRGLPVGDAAVVRRQAARARARAGPRAASSAAVRSSSVRFWNTPPESTTSSSPLRSAAVAQASAVATRDALVEAARRSPPTGTPAATSAAMRARSLPRGSSTRRPPSSRSAASRRPRCRPSSAQALKLNCSLTLVRHLRA